MDLSKIHLHPLQTESMEMNECVEEANKPEWNDQKEDHLDEERHLKKEQPQTSIDLRWVYPICGKY